MRTAFLRLAPASCLLIALTFTTAASVANGPSRVPPQARWTAQTAAVEEHIDSLLELTLDQAGSREILAAVATIRSDTTLPPEQRDAALYGYLQRLRDHPPGTAPSAVLEQLSHTAPLAVVGHEEAPWHQVALFNIAAAARGLANEWSWRDGHERVRATPPAGAASLAGELDALSADDPRYRGMLAAVAELPGQRLDALALHCASTPGGCGPARADIELARHNSDWLASWASAAPPSDLLPRLARVRRHLPRKDANDLMRAALSHRDRGVAAWAMSDLTSHLPKDSSLRREWGERLIGLLDDPALGGAAALQLARMDSEDWLEAAARRPLSENARRRLDLLAQMESTLSESGKAGGGDK